MQKAWHCCGTLRWKRHLRLPRCLSSRHFSQANKCSVSKAGTMNEDSEDIYLNPHQTVTQVGKNNNSTFICIAYVGLERIHVQSYWNTFADSKVGRSGTHSFIHLTHLLNSYYVPGNTLGRGNIYGFLYLINVYMCLLCARHWFKHFTNINSLNPQNNPTK